MLWIDDMKPKEEKRDVFSKLVQNYRLSQDDEEKRDLLFRISNLGDSRSLIFLIKRYQEENYETKKKILYALINLGDPRSLDFLRGISNKNFLKKLASDAINFSLNNIDYEYEFCERKGLYLASKNKEGYIIRTYDDVLSIEKHLIEDLTYRQLKPQTYVVIGTDFILGGELNEHVEVASGRRVKAAGEAGFIYEEGKWQISSLNNRSYGYLPAKATEVHTINALNRIGIPNPGRFTEVFPRDGYTQKYFSDLDENY